MFDVGKWFMRLIIISSGIAAYSYPATLARTYITATYKASTLDMFEMRIFKGYRVD